jgi:hypothetical protein
MIRCLLSITGTRGQYVSREVFLPVKPSVGDYVCETPGALGLKVAIVLISPEGVTCKIREEQAGDFDFVRLLNEGWDS